MVWYHSLSTRVVQEDLELVLFILLCKMTCVRYLQIMAISYFRPLINIHESNYLLINIHRV